MRGEGFSITGGGLLQSGLLLGYFDHRLRWVTSGPRHTDMDANAYVDAQVSRSFDDHVHQHN